MNNHLRSLTIILILFLSLNHLLSPDQTISEKNTNIIRENNLSLNFISKSSDPSNYWLIQYSNENQDYIRDLLLKTSYKFIDDLEYINTFVIEGSQEIDLFGKKYGIHVQRNLKWNAFPTETITSINSNMQNEYIPLRELINANTTSLSGKDIVVAVLDSGLDLDSVYLKDKIIYSKSMVEAELDPTDLNGHGTHVAGILTGDYKEFPQYNGIAPNVKIVNIKIADKTGQISFYELMKGINEISIINNNNSLSYKISIINLSLGYEFDDPTSLLSAALDSLSLNNVDVAMAAGNNGDKKFSINTPGSSQFGLTVGAYNTSNNKIATFSSRGPSSDLRIDPDIVAPGVDIISTLSSRGILLNSSRNMNPSKLQTQFYPLSGTSMSTPIIAGSLALLREKYPNLSSFALKTALIKGAKNLELSEIDQGAGLVDINSTLQILENSMNSDVEAETEIFTTLPKASIIFKDYSIPEKIFPNEQYKLIITVIMGKKGIPIVDLDNNNTLKSVVSLVEKNPLTGCHENGFGSEECYTQFTSEFQYHFQLDVNPTKHSKLGIYFGDIKVDLFNQTHIIKIRPFQVIAPKLKVYWSTAHSFPLGYPNRSGIYNEFDNIARDLNIFFDPVDEYISSYRLSSYDVLVIAYPSDRFFRQEIGAIGKFVEIGGNVLILGNSLSFPNYYYFNDLIEQFGVTFTSTSTLDLEFNYPKNKWIYDQKEMILNDDALFKGLDSYNWIMGTLLKISGANLHASSTISHDDQIHPAIVDFKGNNTHKGRLLIFGDDSSISDNTLKEQFIQEEKSKLIKINLLNEFTNNISIVPYLEKFDYRINESIEILLQIWENNSQITQDLLNPMEIFIPEENNTYYITSWNNSGFIFLHSFLSDGIKDLIISYSGYSETIQIKVYSAVVVMYTCDDIYLSSIGASTSGPTNRPDTFCVNQWPNGEGAFDLYYPELNGFYLTAMNLLTLHDSYAGYNIFLGTNSSLNNNYVTEINNTGNINDPLEMYFSVSPRSYEDFFFYSQFYFSNEIKDIFKEPPPDPHIKNIRNMHLAGYDYNFRPYKYFLRNSSSNSEIVLFGYILDNRTIIWDETKDHFMKIYDDISDNEIVINPKVFKLYGRPDKIDNFISRIYINDKYVCCEVNPLSIDTKLGEELKITIDHTVQGDLNDKFSVYVGLLPYEAYVTSGLKIDYFSEEYEIDRQTFWLSGDWENYNGGGDKLININLPLDPLLLLNNNYSYSLTSDQNILLLFAVKTSSPNIETRIVILNIEDLPSFKIPDPSSTITTSTGNFPSMDSKTTYYSTTGSKNSRISFLSVFMGILFISFVIIVKRKKR